MGTKKDRSKATWLSKLKVREVSLVDEGEDPLAPVSIFKRAGDADETDPILKAYGEPQTTDEVLEAREAIEEWQELRGAFTESLYSILDFADPKDRLALLKKTVEEFSAAVKDILPSLPGPINKAAGALFEAATGADPEGDVLPDTKAILAADAALGRANETLLIAVAKAAGAKEDVMVFDKSKLDAAGQEYVAALEKRASEGESRLKALESEVTVLKGKVPAAAAAEVNTADLPEPIRKRFEESEARLKAAEEEVSKRRSADEQREAVEKARTLPGIPASVEDLGEVIRVVKAKAPEVADKLDVILKAASGAVKASGIFKAVGTDGVPAGATDAEAQMNAKAQEIAKAKGISFHKAYDEAVQLNPGLAGQAARTDFERKNAGGN
jgi:hypothetical protein